MKNVLVAILLIITLAGSGAAELVTVSQFGYHPLESKQVVSYTSVSSGTATVYTSTGSQVMSVPLSKALDYYGNPVNCQGNDPCLVADISSLPTGTYYVRTSIGGQSPNFVVNNNVYQTNAPVFLEFFNAELQQHSAYHADKHAGFTPQLNTIADGSFIMEADQASTTLIRLGSAYRENPALFSSDRYTIYAAGKPDMVEYIKGYADYLKGLQGVRVTERTDGVGFRLDRGVQLTNAFVPGPTSLTSLNVYNPGNPPTLVQSVPVVSLCSGKTGADYTSCVNYAASYYKCQVDEPCLNSTYVDRTGTVSYQSNDYSVSTGWSYEFGCYFDVHISETQYINNYNPCMIFRPEASRTNTVHALLAYLEALPAVNDYSTSDGQALFNRAVDTYNYVKSNYNLTGDDFAFVGASEFLLYDYTGDSSYLVAAYGKRDLVDKTLASDRLRGNEPYWEEYIRHKQAITALGMTYSIAGENPEEYFRGKMWGDWKDLGSERSISRTGERVFQYDNNIQFQNSRYMLTEGLLAAKTAQLHPAPESFIPLIADSQLSWLTGQNAVQLGTGSNPPIGSLSFIFGIGNFPHEQHSRYYVDSGYLSATGRIVGARGSNYQFYNGTDYVYFDGTANILGYQLGSLGNKYRGEPYNEPFNVNKTFSNGAHYIPGWINGVFDIPEDTDTIFNYRDTTGTYENTETTNEMVSTAIELLAYLDSERNNRARAAVPHFSYSSSCTPSTEVCDGVDNNCNGQVDENNVCGNTNACYNTVKDIPVSCTSTITSDTWNGCRAVNCGTSTNNIKVLACDKSGYFEVYKQSVTGSAPRVCFGSTCIQNEGYMKSTNFPICSTNTTTCTPSTEVCDGIDNNCNGLVDENNVCAPTCTPTTEVCDGRDNNCNGLVDENNVCGTSSNTCFNSVKDVPANCTSTITSDTWNGCRTLICGTTSNNIKVLSCDKTGYFEMYKQSVTGTPPKVCLDGSCMQNEGYVKSTNFPICSSTNSTNTTTCTPSTEICDGIDNNCNGQIDENNVCAVSSQASVTIAPWYPKGRTYVFKCAANNNPTRYHWFFGNGEKNLYGGSDVYYTYPAAGAYTVTCNAVGATTVSGTLQVTVT